jgi:hypothetical protein
MKSLHSEITVSRLAESAQRATAAEIALGSITAQPDKVPAGWRSTGEWAEIWQVSRSTANQRIMQHIRACRMISKMFKQREVSGRCVPRPLYKVK